MKNRTFNGKDIGDSAVRFFEELAKLESGGNYELEDQKSYIGKYQIGTDILMDMGWLPKGSKWSNARFIGEAVSKWKLTDKRSFLRNHSAQDEVIMRSLVLRWKTLKKYKEKICKVISVPNDAIYINPGKHRVSEEKVKKILKKKRAQNYKAEDLRGKKFILTSSGMLAASHLCGQGAISNALGNNFKGVYGIPVDGNAMPSLLYHENLSGYDLSVIIGYKDNCEIDNKVVLKNDSNDDNKNINKQSKTLEKSNVKGEAVEDKEGVYIFNGQKFQEVWDNEEYKKDRAENKKAPDIVFVNSNEVVLKRLQAKFQDESMYNKDYVKYIETTTAKKVLDENKEDINVILKIYDEATKNNENIGNVIRQHGFDLLRGRDGINEVLKIQDIIYYIFSYPIPNKSKIESLEYVLSQYSVKYVLFPDQKPLRENSENKELSLEKIKNIVNEVNTGNENVSERKVEKNNLPEKYNKYMEGIKDIDEIVIRVTKKPSSEFPKTKCENLIKDLGESDEHGKSYSTDENGVRHFPLARRLIDNIIIEFLKVQTGFKEEKEIKYFDNHKYKDSNIVRNYLLWYVEKQNGIDLPSKNENGLYNRLEKLGKEMRVTTILNDWISSKSAIKVKNIRKISNLIDEVYSEYRDNNDFEKDKSIIHNLFKDSKELRDYAANIDSMDLYSFYRKFYDLKNIVKPNQEMFVNDNCMLKCTLGQDISRLIIAEDSVTLKGGKQANINDKKIMPFKMCKAIGICKPELLATWEKNTDVKVRNHPALLDISTIQCKHGGTVSIDDAGQKEMGTAVTENKKNEEAQRDADCEYKLLIDICRDVNNNFMQTELKKSSQKYAKWKKYKQETEKRTVEYLKNDVKEVLGLGKADEKKKKEYEKFVKDNKKKMEIAKTEASETREKELKNKIMSTFVEVNKRVKQLSGPKLDTKGVIRKSGISLCDYERKNFYSAKILPAIVYGYLMKAGNLNMNSQERQTIENELNKDVIGIGTVNIDLTGYGIDSKFKKSKDSQKMKIPSSEIMTWVGIGESLYATVKNIPTEWDIQNKIREQGKSVGRCPFSQMEWNQNHKENRYLTDAAPLTKKIEKDKSNKTSSNKAANKTVSDNKNEIVKNSVENSTESFCKGDNCPHVGVQGYYTLYVERFGEYYNTDSKNWSKENAKKNSTISYFSILDPSGKKVEGYDGYIIEPGGPDEIASNKNRRIVQGTHQLAWHDKSPTKYSERYMTMIVYSKNISMNRGILIHYGLDRSWSIGCLLPSTKEKIVKHHSRGNIYFAEDSKKFFDKIMNFVYKVEKINKTSNTAQNIHKDKEGEVKALELHNKNNHKRREIKNVKLVIKNNIIKTIQRYKR